MNNLELISKSDFIITFGTMLLEDNNTIKNSIDKQAKFIYMHPVNNSDLSDSYTQFIKYEVGSEEGICALLLDTFVKNSDETTQKYIDDLDLGYISAESSAGEEEFEEAYEESLKSKVKTLIIGDDLIAHDRVDNIIKFLALIKKYTDLNVIVLNDELSQKIDSCDDLNLEEVEDLKSYNGTLLYTVFDGEDSDKLLCSQTFANIAKVKHGDEVFVNFKNNRVNKVIEIDDKLSGTISIAKVNNKNEEIFDAYRFKQVKIEKVDA